MVKFTRAYNDDELRALELRKGAEIWLRLHGVTGDQGGFTIASNNPSVVRVVRQVLFDGPRGIWSVRVAAPGLGEAVISVTFGDNATIQLPIVVVAPISLPASATREGLWVRLFLSETRNPINRLYDSDETRTAMGWMRRIVVNRLANNPAQFGASGAKTVFDIVKAPGQFAGFEHYPQVSADVHNRIHEILRIANDDGDQRQAAMAAYLRMALQIANAPDAVADPSDDGLYGWRTLGSGSPGPRFKAYNSPKSGNQFYTLTAD